jgi:hypothetical protein
VEGWAEFADLALEFCAFACRLPVLYAVPVTIVMLRMTEAIVIGRIHFLIGFLDAD